VHHGAAAASQSTATSQIVATVGPRLLDVRRSPNTISPAASKQGISKGIEEPHCSLLLLFHGCVKRVNAVVFKTSTAAASIVCRGNSRARIRHELPPRRLKPQSHRRCRSKHAVLQGQEAGCWDCKTLRPQHRRVASTQPLTEPVLIDADRWPGCRRRVGVIFLRGCR
jgi:hypothetical protein